MLVAEHAHGISIRGSPEVAETTISDCIWVFNNTLCRFHLLLQASHLLL